MDIQGIQKRAGRCLGSGARGTVYEGFDPATGTLVAIKEYPIGDDVQKAAAEIANEIALMRDLDHPNLIKYFGVRKAEENGEAPTTDFGSSSSALNNSEGSSSIIATPHTTIQIVMEYMNGGSLGSIIKRYGALRESAARRYMKDILTALQHLHEVCRVCHRDIKPENILLAADGTCKLADFGASKVIHNDTSMLKSCVGTPWYMAPEVIQGVGYAVAADIWGAGCCLFEMLVGKHPFYEVPNPMAVMFRVGSQDDVVPELPSDVHVSPECAAFLKDCLIRDPSQRRSAAQLLQHPWITAQEGLPKEEILFEKTASLRQGELGDAPDKADVVSTTSGGGGEDAEFFPGKDVYGPHDFTAMCQRCDNEVALFECDACRELNVRYQLCPACWDESHNHVRSTSHFKQPLLLPSTGIPGPEKPGGKKREVPRATSSSVGDAATGGLMLASGDFVDIYQGEQSEWICGRCQSVNDGPEPVCTTCGHER